MKELLNRRGFLKIAALGAVDLVLNACAPSAPTPPNTTPILLGGLPTPPFAPPSPDLLHGRDRLFAEIDDLPESRLKQLLIERIKPYFSSFTYPMKIERGGLTFTVQSATVNERVTNSPDMHGTFTPRGGTPATEYHPTKTNILRLPLLYTVTHKDLGGFPKEQIASDGTPFINITLRPEHSVFEGNAPVITIETPQANFRKPELAKFYVASEKFAYIKEACSLLIDDIRTEEVIKKMKALGFETEIEVNGPNGVSKVENVTQLLQVENVQRGRSLAGEDIGGYFLAMKAFGGKSTILEDIRDRDKIFDAALKSADQIQIGNDLSEIARASFQWAIDSNEARRLFYEGDMNKIPMNINPNSTQYSSISTNNFFVV